MRPSFEPKMCHLCVGWRVSCERLSVRWSRFWDMLRVMAKVVRIVSVPRRSHVGSGRRMVSVKHVVGNEEWIEDVLCRKIC